MAHHKTQLNNLFTTFLNIKLNQHIIDTKLLTKISTNITTG